MPNVAATPRALRATTSIALAGLLVLVACNTGAPPTAGPDVTPGASPGPASTGAPSSTPGQVGEIDHPTEPTAVVLRMFVGGGFVPLELALTEAPVFTLYGDNTVIFRPQATEAQRLGPLSGDPAYIKATMNAEQVDALLRFALGAGGLLDARESYTDIGVADAPNTIFTIDAGGVQKVVTIAALGFDQVGAEAADRAKFFVLADLLDSFEEQVAAGQVETTEVYRPEAYRGFLTESFPGQVGELIDWPWDDLSLDDFPSGDEPTRATTLTPEQVGAVTTEPTGGVAGLRISDEDGTVWQLAIRPLLPDEVANLDLDG